MTAVERSYAYCRKLARSKAKNFYYSFVLLSRDQRNAMCAVYTFMRKCDDLSDEPGAGASPELFDHWRNDMVLAMAGQYGEDPCWPALHDAVRRYKIPISYFHEMIDGVASDLYPRDIQTFAELYRYCYQVASVVGLTVTHIFGFDSPEALVMAEKCGIAFQLTNIIRDVQEDQAMGRIYLPREDRDRFPDLKELLAFEGLRAKQYYAESRGLIQMVHPGSRKSLWALIEIYRRLLDRIEKSGYDVMSTRIRLSGAEKAGIVLEAFWRRV